MATTPPTSSFRISDHAKAHLGHTAINKRKSKGEVLDDAIANITLDNLLDAIRDRYNKEQEETPAKQTSFNLSQDSVSKLGVLSKRTHLSVNFIVTLIAESV